MLWLAIQTVFVHQLLLVMCIETLVIYIPKTLFLDVLTMRSLRRTVTARGLLPLVRLQTCIALLKPVSR